MDIGWAWFAAVVVCVLSGVVSWLIRLYIGDAPVVVVKDLDMIEKIFVKNLKNFTSRGHMTHVHELQPLFVRNILFTKGNVWKDMRHTMAQFFTPTKLKSVMPCLMDALKRFIEILDECAERGDEVDINTLCERLTFDVISKAAFGIDTNVQRNPQHPLFQSCLATVPNYMAGFFYNLAHSLPMETMRDIATNCMVIFLGGLITRGSDEDFQYGNYIIKKGMTVLSPTYHLHHDPLYWSDPEKFDPERTYVSNVEGQ
ncbi:thromboxane-A synthase [Dermacentor silvarum]|uniref:thromboxane-A synthase n=1 Tax=Dermacentor silvarum TaxID=543639 RepID=UPI00189A7F04|nr:thromboxane-A synthase [Dermacentor silvarum]